MHHLDTTEKMTRWTCKAVMDRSYDLAFRWHHQFARRGIEDGNAALRPVRRVERVVGVHGHDVGVAGDVAAEGTDDTAARPTPSITQF